MTYTIHSFACIVVLFFSFISESVELYILNFALNVFFIYFNFFFLLLIFFSFLSNNLPVISVKYAWFVFQRYWFRISTQSLYLISFPVCIFWAVFVVIRIDTYSFFLFPSNICLGDTKNGTSYESLALLTYHSDSKSEDKTDDILYSNNVCCCSVIFSFNM